MLRTSAIRARNNIQSEQEAKPWILNKRDSKASLLSSRHKLRLQALALRASHATQLALFSPDPPARGGFQHVSVQTASVTVQQTQSLTGFWLLTVMLTRHGTTDLWHKTLAGQGFSIQSELWTLSSGTGEVSLLIAVALAVYTLTPAQHSCRAMMRKYPNRLDGVWYGLVTAFMADFLCSTQTKRGAGSELYLLYTQIQFTGLLVEGCQCPIIVWRPIQGSNSQLRGWKVLLRVFFGFCWSPNSTQGRYTAANCTSLFRSLAHWWKVANVQLLFGVPPKAPIFSLEGRNSY